MEIHDPQALGAILRSAPFCNVGIVDGGFPIVIPMSFVSDESQLYLHGSTHSRLMESLRAGATTCVSVTLYDGLVLAKSAYNHAMNYRSVSVFGATSEITDAQHKLSVLKDLSDKYVPGRWETVRPPTEQELASVMILRLSLAKISGKGRSGPPGDFEKDLDYQVWSGTIPYELVPKAPGPDPKSKCSLPIPANVLDVLTRGAL